MVNGNVMKGNHAANLRKASVRTAAITMPNANAQAKAKSRIWARSSTKHAPAAPRPCSTWHDPPYRSNTPSDRGALAGHRRHPVGCVAAHAAQQPRRQTVRAAYRRADAVAGHTVFDYCDHRDSRPCNRRTRPTRHRQRGVRGCANRLALGLYQAAANDFPTRPAPQSRRSRPTACPTRPTGTPAS